MQTQRIQPRTDHNSQGGSEHEGMIVWDQRGLVVMWPDGHRSRLSWTALRAACQCAECQEQRSMMPHVSSLPGRQ